MHFSDALPCRASDFPLSTKRIYIRKRAKIWCKIHLKSGHAEWSASENCIWSFTYSFKKIVRLHFPRRRLRDPSKYQLFLRKKHWFWPSAKRFPRAKPLLFPKEYLIFWGPAGATPRKVQNDIPFKAIKHSPNALFRCAPLPRLRFSTFHETYIYIQMTVNSGV